MSSSVVVAMSGGVDSSVAAALLIEAGYEVVGITMKLHDEKPGGGAGCCTVDDAEDARSVAHSLGIPHYVVDLRAEFASAVIRPYVSEHASGRTPNPCVECNRTLKFEELVARADLLGIDLVATGHHAGIREGRLVRGADPLKDQSYVLACVSPELLPRLTFPIGDLAKVEVRDIAERLGLRTARKADSMEVCFLTGGRAAFLRRHLDLVDGDVVDRDGAVVGTHRGAALLTVGQRRGLGVAVGRPLYVERVDTGSNTVAVGPAPPVCRGLRASDPVWFCPPPSEWRRAEAQTSAHGTPRPCRMRDAGGVVEVDFEGAVQTPAPGQLVAFYEGDVVLGSAVVSSGLPRGDR